MTDAEIVAELKRIASLPLLSPSAPYDLRHKAHDRVKAGEYGPNGKWWEVYPEGQLAAFVFRAWHVLGLPTGYLHEIEEG